MKESHGATFLCWLTCFCAPCSNASLKRFFSQMRIVKTDWRNGFESVFRTTIYCLKAVELWYNDKNYRLNQKPRRKYTKRKASKPPRKEFELPSLFEISSESELSSDEDLLI